MFSLLAKREHRKSPARSISYFDWHWLGRSRALIGIFLGIIAAIATVQSGLAHRTDEQFRIIRESLLERPATGKIHLLEIDAKSIAALSSWPWKRHIHGKIVDKLNQAGAETIAFDVDFSSPSSLLEDRSFGHAIERSSATVVLPTFIQHSTTNGSAVAENIPIAVLREHAFLASVNVHPDADGTIRNIEYGTVTDGVARPTMAAVLAHANGDIGHRFRINTSIDPASLPRHSVIDLLNDELPPGSLKGKSVFIGATAIELGDRYPMSRHGVQPGVVIQALAAETLMQGSTFVTLDYALSLVFALIAGAVIISRIRIEAALIVGGIAMTGLLAAPLLIELSGFGTINIASALYGLSAIVFVVAVAYIFGRFNYIRLVDIETGLPNRRSMTLELTNSHAEYVVVMEIENFDEFSAILDENARLSLLDSVIRTLALGSAGATIFRIGQHRFGWLSALEDVAFLTETIEGIQAVLAFSASSERENVVIDTSFGIARAVSSDKSTQIQNAILAARQATVMGTRWSIFTEDMSDRNGYIQKVLSGLDDAIELDDIYLLLQPKWSIRQQRIAGVEALVRWNHATLGPISPSEFIPILEQHHQMAKLTLEIARRCGQIALAWQKEGRDASVALNISAPLLSDPRFTTSLADQLQSLGPAVRQLTFEITESATVTDDESIIASLERYRANGVKISIDDYGTGQSTLSYLQKLPADEIKIDQSFVRNLLTSRSDQILVRSTIELGHELGLSVVAEGVEDEATMALLASYNVDMIQGWHIGRPMSFQEVTKLMGKSKTVQKSANG